MNEEREDASGNVLFSDAISYLAAMQGVFAAVSLAEYIEFRQWEKDNVGINNTATSDWPGFEKYIGIAPWNYDRATGNKVRQPVSGVVYILRAPNGLCKIGKAKDLKTRLMAYRTHSSEPLDLMVEIASNDITATEQAIHAEYADKREHGEWFRLTTQDVEVITVKHWDGTSNQ